MEPIKIRMKQTKETKGTFVYASDAEDAAVTTIYIRKDALDGEEPPKSIVVEIRKPLKKKG